MTSLTLPHVATGKVRDMYDAGDRLLMVASDRVSVFDVVLPTPIPGKGAVLTGLSIFWFDLLERIVPSHLVAWKLSELPEANEDLVGRSMLVRKAEMLPVECVVRGYLAGSGWKEYQKSQSVCGISLPAGLRESDELPEPIFTPTTKAAAGHDEAIDFDEAARLIGDRSLAERVRDVSIELYLTAAAHARSKGIILCDTKFEFGMVAGELTICDEVFTPDSSRFWPADEYTPGGSPPSFDKQFVRNYAETVGWDKTAPGPELPDDIVAGTQARYREAYERLTGRSFDDYMREAGS